jgi:hypothetical protein
MRSWTDQSIAMTTTSPRTSLTEFCEDCKRETSHAVTIQLRVENANADHAKCSREPYRVSECQNCDASTALRMNDA